MNIGGPRISSLLVLVTLLSGCTTFAPEHGRSQHDGAQSGLGTGWGENVDSPVTRVRFDRSARPLALETLYYDDAAGLKPMAPLDRRPESTGWFESQGSYISYGLRAYGGGMLPGFQYQGRKYVRGYRGDRYSIEIKNNTDVPLTLVVSVDGLDVLDGRPADIRKGGYLVESGGQLTVAGWRRSLNDIAAFTFSSVPNSYTNFRYGDTQNIGVIGIAAFADRNMPPRIMGRDKKLRQRANPFPGDFARPPY